MRKLIYVAPLLAIAIILVSWVDRAPAELLNRVVAVVGDEMISAQDLDRVLSVMQEQVKGRENEFSSQDLGHLRQLALDRLIEETLFDQQIKKLGIRVRPAEIDAYIERVRASNHMDESAFLAHLSRRGYTPEEYRNELKNDIQRRRLVAQVVQQRVVITDKEIEEYYQQNSGSYTSLGGVMLQALFLKVPADAQPAAAQAIRGQAEELRQKILDGQADFAEMAKQYSEGPGADKGGELGPVKADDLLPSMRNALAELKTGETSPVLEIPSGFVFMKLLDSKGKSNMPPQEMREQIRQKLEKAAYEKAYQNWMKELRASTYIKIFD
jgi:peptidyl-prolyl cis-trans isomerase SurA